MGFIALIIVLAMCLVFSGTGKNTAPKMAGPTKWVCPQSAALSAEMNWAHCWEGGADTRYSVVLGKRDDGACGVFADLATLPNVLVGGTAGSGKSVAIRGMLVSLLSKNSPASLQLVVIDPKMVDYKWCRKLPHTIGFETDTDSSAGLLQRLQDEMMRRYRIMDQMDVDHWDKVGEFHPHILVVIDEFASLMDAGGRKALLPTVQDLAQKGRAAGFHLILATQRPDARVFDTRLKANCLGRVAFRVPNYRDSMTILDSKGAEELKGNGDGLYTCGDGRYTRFQSVYTTLEDAKKVADWWTSPNCECY